MVLTLVLPVALAFGLAARKAAPTNVLTPGISGAVAGYNDVQWRRDDLFPKAPLRGELFREHPGAGRFALKLSARGDFLKPDVLVYWAAGNAAPMDKLAGDAILLGAFGSAFLPLPEVAAISPGVLILYSLADQEIIDVSRPFPQK
jgi:hypothetical protein